MPARSAKYPDQKHDDLDSTGRIRLHEVPSEVDKSKHGICRFVNVEKITSEALGVLFVVLSVLTFPNTLVCARPRSVEADYSRFATRKNRAAAASLVASANARRSYAQR